MKREQALQKLNEAALYAITHLTETNASVLGDIDDAYRGGADIVQLRAKGLSDQDLIDLGRSVSTLAKKYDALFVMNDRVDLAVLCEADGVHLGQGDLDISQGRMLLKQLGREDMLIGKSTHSITQAREAEEEGADYIGVGPVYATPTKPGKNPVGLDYIRQAHSEISIPKVVIGGIDAQNIEEVVSAGARCMAFVRAIFDAPDVFQSTQKIRGIIDGVQIES